MFGCAWTPFSLHLDPLMLGGLGTCPLPRKVWQICLVLVAFWRFLSPNKMLLFQVVYCLSSSMIIQQMQHFCRSWQPQRQQVWQLVDDADGTEGSWLFLFASRFALLASSNEAAAWWIVERQFCRCVACTVHWEWSILQAARVFLRESLYLFFGSRWSPSLTRALPSAIVLLGAWCQCRGAMPL